MSVEWTSGNCGSRCRGPHVWADGRWPTETVECPGPPVIHGQLPAPLVGGFDFVRWPNGDYTLHVPAEEETP